jgi:hypothetical protein
MKALTPAQAHYVREVCKHGNQSEAYRQAYPRSRKWQEQSVKVAASRLMSLANVSLTVAKIRAETEKKAGMSREQFIQKWLDLERDSKSLYDRREALKGIAAACGYNAPLKIETKDEKTLVVRVVGLEDRIRAVLSRSQVSDAEVVGIGSCAKQLEGGAA